MHQRLDTLRPANRPDRALDACDAYVVLISSLASTRAGGQPRTRPRSPARPETPRRPPAAAAPGHSRGTPPRPDRDRSATDRRPKHVPTRRQRARPRLARCGAAGRLRSAHAHPRGRCVKVGHRTWNTRDGDHHVLGVGADELVVDHPPALHRPRVLTRELHTPRARTGATTPPPSRGGRWCTTVSTPPTGARPRNTGRASRRPPRSVHRCTPARSPGRRRAPASRPGSSRTRHAIRAPGTASSTTAHTDCDTTA